MKPFPSHKKTFPYRCLSALLQSFMGICLLLLASAYLTTSLFSFTNQTLEKKVSWSTGWSQRVTNHQLHNEYAAKEANRRCNNCENLVSIDTITPNNKSFQHNALWKKRGETLKNKKEKEKEEEKAFRNALWNKLNETLKSRDESKLEKEKAFRITQIGRTKKAASETTLYLESYSLLELSFTEDLTQRSLKARLWVVALDKNKKHHFSKTLHISLLHQEKKWISGLWPTQTLLEPRNLGRWFVHNQKKITKEYFDAGDLLPKTKLLKRTEIFLNTWTEKTFAHHRQSFTQDTFWFTFFNGTNEWGLIQWISVFLAVFVLLQLSLRSFMTQTESIVLSSYQSIHPLDFQKYENPATLQTLREDYIEKRSLLPHFQSFFLLSAIDHEAANLEEMLTQKIERSRKIIDFLVSSLSSIGFIGTITGIAFAINQAHQVVTPDEFLRLQAIKSLSTDLALAFSTTFVALVFTLICDFFAKLQWQSEDLLLEKLQAIRQAWAWQKKEEAAEQANCSFHIEL